MAKKKLGLTSKEQQEIDEANLWFKRISSSKESMTYLYDEIEENEKLFNGDIIGFDQTGYAKSKNVSVNLLYVDIKQSTSSLYAKNPKIFFNPEIPEAEWSSDLFEPLINNLWKKLKMKTLMREAVKAARLNAVSVFKTYFDFSDNYKKDEWSDRIYNDEVRTDRISIKHIFKDSGACSYEKSPWIAHECEDLLRNIYDKFDLNENEKLRVTVTKTMDTGDFSNGQNDPDFSYGCYYEIEDRQNRKIFYLIKGIDRKLGEKDITYSFDTMYDFLVYNDIPDNDKIHSNVHFWKPQLRELAIYRTMAANHAKKGTAKYKAVGEPLTEEQKVQLITSKDSSIVQLTANQDIAPINHAGIDPSIYQGEQMARADIQLISKNAARQVVGQQKTATEVKAVEAAAQEVESEDLERLEEVMASIATKWAKLIAANYTTERLISLTEMTEAEFMGLRNRLNKDGGEIVGGTSLKPTIKISNKDLSDKVRAGVVAGSTLPDNEQTRMSKLMGFAKFVASIPGAAAALDLEEMIKEAESVFGVRNMNLLKRKENPVQESKLLNSGIFVAAKLSEDHDHHLAIHEKDSNGNYQNALHIQMHKEFQSQIKKNEEASRMGQGGAAGAGMAQIMQMLQGGQTGRSFLGGNSMPPQPAVAPGMGPGAQPNPQPIKVAPMGMKPQGVI